MNEIPGGILGPLKSNVPEGAIILTDTIPPETQISQVSQADLDAAAETRGQLIEEFG